ncbi:MAG: hypothetical protein Q9168_001050 [Polycauliona sp. 1 TL-2023]
MSREEGNDPGIAQEKTSNIGLDRVEQRETTGIDQGPRRGLQPLADSAESSTLKLDSQDVAHVLRTSTQQMTLSNDSVRDDPGSGPPSRYLDPTPPTPNLSAKSSQTFTEKSPPGGDEKEHQEPNASTKAAEEDTTSEIQSIIEQFDGEGHPPDAESVSSPRLEFANSMLGDSIQHPPRRSSLEPVTSQDSSFVGGEQRASNLASSMRSLSNRDTYPSPQAPGTNSTGSVRSLDSPQSARHASAQSKELTSPHSSISGTKPPLPEPDPEPDVPFDFHRFLEQLRHRTADPVAKFLRSFLLEFGKKQWMVHEQVKIISDFLTFITGKMSQCEVWRGASDAEFDNAKEGMEKLVMNRLYTQTFSPAIPPPAPVQAGKSGKRNVEKLTGPGRKGQHQEDFERDDILGQKVRIYGWVQEEHLDVAPLGDNGRRFMSFAQQQLLKIKMYRAPRDKVVCVLNCCKVIFGFLSTSKSSDTSADSFVPLLIYVVLRANPEHLVSNVQYILRFRDQDKLGGEAGYYLSSLMGAIQFIENLDRTSLTISDEEFEKKVEASVSEIAERHEEEEEPLPRAQAQAQAPAPPPRPTHISEKSALSEPEMIPRHSMEAEYNTASRPLSSRDPTDSRPSNGNSQDSNAVTGLLRTIQKPLSSIGRMFSDDGGSSSQNSGSSDHVEHPSLPPSSTPLRLSPAVFQPPRNSLEEVQPSQGPNRSPPLRMSAEDAAARQASAEAAEAQRIQRNEHRDVVDTLAGMFPDLDRDIIDDVVREKHGSSKLPSFRIFDQSPLSIPKTSIRNMAGRNDPRLIDHWRWRNAQNYGTTTSESSSTTDSSASHQGATEPISHRFRCICYTVIALFISLALIFFLSSLNNHHDSSATSLSPPISHQRVQRYLWVIEHDGTARDTSLATQMYLYISDGLTTKACDGGSFAVESWIWIADLYLEDVLEDPELYKAVLEADLLFCEHTEMAIITPSRSMRCQPVGNSYFSHSTSRSWWPSVKAFDGTVDLNLAIRPQIQGKPRIRPCVCEMPNTDKTDVTVSVHRTSHRLMVDCPKLLAFDPEGIVPEEDNDLPLSAWRGEDTMLGALAPGFYVVPGRHPAEHQSNTRAVQLGDSLQDEKAQTNPSAPQVAPCTLRSGLWARYCRGNAQRWQANVLSTSRLDGILRRAPSPNDPKPLKHPLIGLWVAIGMLGFFSALALAGALVRRELQRRARLDVAGTASLEELEEASRNEEDRHPRYIRLLRRYLCVWGRRPSDRLHFKQTQALKRKEDWNGSGRRKLQKTKGTRFEDPTELRPRVISAASAVPVKRPIDEGVSNEKRPSSVAGADVDHDAAEQIGGTSTAQEPKARSAATRRSNRSTSIHDGHEEGP